jgi:hypothetical protein
MMESYSDWRGENNLDEMHGGTMSKLGPREKGRKDKGKRRPQAIRQAKARTKALKQKLNTEEIGVEESFRHAQSRIDLYKKQTNRKARKMYVLDEVFDSHLGPFVEKPLLVSRNNPVVG